MASPVNISKLFAQLKEAQAPPREDEPDWLLEADTQEVAERQGRASESSDDPFLLIESPAVARQGAEEAGPSRDDGPSTSCPSAHIQPKGAQGANGTARGGTHTQTANRAADGAHDGLGPGQVLRKGTSRPERSAGHVGGAGSTADGASMVVTNAEGVGFNRLLVEIPAGQNDAMDLSGDAGAVGRLSSIGDDGKGFTMLLDLKGVVYNAALVEIPCTACVVAMGQHEAKIEAYFNEFLQLEESTLFQDTEVLEGGNIDAWTAEDTGDMDATTQATSAPKETKRVKRRSAAGARIASGKVVKVTTKAKKGKSGKGNSTGKK